MLPNDRLGKNRLPVCPRGQIADVLEPLAERLRRTQVASMQRRARAASVSASMLEYTQTRVRKRRPASKTNACGGGGGERSFERAEWSVRRETVSEILVRTDAK